MTRILLQLGAFFLLLMLVSCEGQTDFRHYLINQSTDTLLISIDWNTYLGGDTTMKIIPGETKLLLESYRRGGDPSGEDASEHIRAASGITSNGDSLIKDMMLPFNWEVYQDHRKKIPSWYIYEYYFTVRSGDLE